MKCMMMHGPVKPLTRQSRPPSQPCSLVRKEATSRTRLTAAIDRFKKQYPGRSRQYILAGLAVHALCNSMKEDFERAEQGYAKVAGLISNFPELANFRRFQTLNIQNLLYMQAEITHLECDLKELAIKDLRSGKNLDHHYDWWSLAHDESESARQQWQLIQEIRSKLEKYSEHADPHMHTALSVLFKP
jgi:hypothetical protein